MTAYQKLWTLFALHGSPRRTSGSRTKVLIVYARSDETTLHLGTIGHYRITSYSEL